MGITDWFKKNEKVEEVVFTPSLSSQSSTIFNTISEQFKGEVVSNKRKFPVELGEEHPFDFAMTEGLYKKYGFFTAVVDKYVDFVVGPGFYVKAEDERVQEIIDNFMRDINFDTILRAWTKEALIKGNGFLEIGGNEKEGIKGLKVLNANYMYVDRDKYGKIESYNQYKGAFDKFAKEKVINFKPKQIAHVPFNVVGDCAYGLGIGYPAVQFVNSSLEQSKNMHTIMNRKANSPLHAKLGKIDGDTKIVPKPADVTAFGKEMETMHNKIDWATDPLVEFKVVDFGNIGDKFKEVLEYDTDMLIYAFQIPAVILGKANVAEGLARVQMEAFQRRIQSIQAELEKIIEQQIFKRVLNANGFGDDIHVEFEWGTPSIIEVEGKMQLISDMIKSPTSSMAMKEILEDELITMLKLDEDEWENLKMEMQKKQEEERKRFENQAQPVVPGQNRSLPKPTPPKTVQPKQPNPEEIAQIIFNKLQAGKKNIKEMRDNIRNGIFVNQLLPEPKEQKTKEKVIQKKIKPKLPTKHKVKEIINYEFEKPCAHCEEKWENITDIEEWLGFSYAKYLAFIKTSLETYDFEYIKGVTESQIAAGMFTESQIEELRKIMNVGFSKGKSMTEMAKEIDKKVKPKDLLRMEDGKLKVGASGLPILARSAEKRSIGIVRTEVTRLANKGAVEYYKQNGIKQVEWVASFGDRTCPECEALNGKIYEITKYPEIPVHPLCRCTLTPVTELK